MKFIKLSIISISIIIFFSPFVVPVDSTKASTLSPSYPAEGTTLTYNLTWINVSLIGVYNSTHIDFSEHPEADFTVEYPLQGQYTVSFHFYDEFLEEAVEGIITNDSTHFTVRRSNLIDITTRQYVNEEGEASDVYTFRYIDPNNVSLGQTLPIERRLAKVTAKTPLNILDTEQIAWHLEDLELNMTYFYDVASGILLESVYWRSDHSAFSHYLLTSWKKPTPQITSFNHLIFVLFGFLLLILIRKHGL